MSCWLSILFRIHQWTIFVFKHTTKRTGLIRRCHTHHAKRTGLILRCYTRRKEDWYYSAVSYTPQRGLVLFGGVIRTAKWSGRFWQCHTHCKEVWSFLAVSYTLQRGLVFFGSVIHTAKRSGLIRQCHTFHFISLDRTHLWHILYTISWSFLLWIWAQRCRNYVRIMFSLVIRGTSWVRFRKRENFTKPVTLRISEKKLRNLKKQLSYRFGSRKRDEVQ